MQIKRSRHITISGIAAILLMLTAVMGLWIVDTRGNSHRIEHIARLQLRSTLVSTMRDVAMERAISLHRMEDLTDLFERDAEYMHFRAIAEDFIKARDQLLASKDHWQLEADLWDRLKPALNRGAELQNLAAEKILRTDAADNDRELLQQLRPAQIEVRDLLNELMARQKRHMETEIDETLQHRVDSYRLIVFLGSVTLLLTAFMIVLQRRGVKTENAHLEQSRKIRALYETSALPGSTVQEKIVQILKLGCEFLGMAGGKVYRIDADLGLYTVGFSYTRRETGCELASFTQLPFRHLVADLGLQPGRLLAVHDVAQSAYCQDTGADGAFICKLIDVNQQPDGIVAFVDDQSMRQNFTDDEKDLLNLIATWISMSLERLVKERELEDARDMSESANRTKSAFLANMSHELRTPLNAIIGYSELVGEMSQGKIEPEYLEDLRKITRSGKHLLALINDILDVSKIESGKVELHRQSVDVDALLAEVSSTVAPIMEKNANSFTVSWSHELRAIYADPVRLRQILINLLGNAAKFCRRGHVHLKLAVDDVLGFKRLMFSVQDNGMGIAPEKLKNLFKPFTQLHDHAAGDFGGTGLGLAISKRLALLMDGNIDAQSEPGVSTVFTLWIPLVNAYNEHNVYTGEQVHQ